MNLAVCATCIGIPDPAARGKRRIRRRGNAQSTTYERNTRDENHDEESGHSGPCSTRPGEITPPPDRVKGDVKAKFKFSADKNVVIQVGGKLKAFRLGDDNENDRDDD